MAQSKRKPCNRCGEPCFGYRCRRCSFELKSSAERFAGGPEGIQLPKKMLPKRSWWAEDQEYFYHIAEGEYDERMSKGDGVSYVPKFFTE